MNDSSSYYLFFALYIESFNLGKDNMTNSTQRLTDITVIN